MTKKRLAIVEERKIFGIQHRKIKCWKIGIRNEKTWEYGVRRPIYELQMNRELGGKMFENRFDGLEFQKIYENIGLKK